MMFSISFIDFQGTFQTQTYKILMFPMPTPAHDYYFFYPLLFFLFCLSFLVKWHLYKNQFNKFCVQSFRNTLNGEPSLLIDWIFQQQQQVFFLNSFCELNTAKNKKKIYLESTFIPPLYRRQCNRYTGRNKYTFYVRAQYL